MSKHQISWFDLGLFLAHPFQNHGTLSGQEKWSRPNFYGHGPNSDHGYGRRILRCELERGGDEASQAGRVGQVDRIAARVAKRGVR